MQLGNLGMTGNPLDNRFRVSEERIEAAGATLRYFRPDKPDFTAIRTRC